MGIRSTHLARHAPALLIVMIAGGCAPYRLEVGPQYGQAPPPWFEARLESLLAAQQAESGESAEKQATASSSTDDTPEGSEPADSQEEHALVNHESQVQPRSDDPTDDLPLADVDLLDRLGGGDHFEADSDDDVIAELDRELQRARSARQALAVPKETAESLLEAARESTSSTSDSADGHRRQLYGFLSRLAADGVKTKRTGKATTAAPADAAPVAAPTPAPTTRTAVKQPARRSARKPIDTTRTHAPTLAAGSTESFSLGKYLFRSGDYKGALRALKMVDLVALAPQDRLLARYLTGVCHSKQQNWQAAWDELDAVARSKGDQMLVDNANWHLNSIRWKLQVQGQLDQINQTSTE